MAKRKKTGPRTNLGRAIKVLRIGRKVRQSGRGKTEASMRREVKAELKREFGDGEILEMILRILELLLPLLMLI